MVKVRMADEDRIRLLAELANLRRSCEALGQGGNPLVRQMAAADVHSIHWAIEAIQRCGDGDSASVTSILGSLQPSGSHVRAAVLELAQNWRLKTAPEDEDPALEEDDLFERVKRDGMLLTYEDWDSGGPGAGAGRVCVYQYDGAFYSTHDAGMSGPYATEDEACRTVGISMSGEG